VVKFLRLLQRFAFDAVLPMLYMKTASLPMKAAKLQMAKRKSPDHRIALTKDPSALP